MEVLFADRKVAKIFESERDMRRTYGAQTADKLAMRRAALVAAETLEDMRPPALGRCEELSGDWAGCLSLRLTANWRLIFSPTEYEMDKQGGLDWSSVTSVTIEEIKDYH
ncbi:type II toxin-antitoxin system RelE/ParE family toxin [Streptomyces sp. NPDC059373]